MKLQQLEQQLRLAGWRLKRISASHRQYRNQRGALVVVAVHGNQRVRPDIWRCAMRDIRRVERQAQPWTC